MALHAFRVFFLLFWSYRKAQFSTNESTKIRHFDFKISEIFWGGGTAPSPDLFPCGEGDTPSPHPILLGAFGASIRLVPSALGTALFSTPNCKMLATALHPNIAKNSLKTPFRKVQGHSRSSMLINPKSLSPVLVMISSMYVLICNRVHATRDNCSKITTF